MARDFFLVGVQEREREREKERERERVTDKKEKKKRYTGREWNRNGQGQSNRMSRGEASGKQNEIKPSSRSPF